MIFYTLYVRAYNTFEIGKSDNFDFDRTEWSEILKLIEALKYYPVKIRDYYVVQYAFNEHTREVENLNSFDIKFPGDNMIYEPYFVLRGIR